MTTTTATGRRGSRTARSTCAAAGGLIIAGLATASATGSALARDNLLVCGCLLGTASAGPVIRDTIRGRARPPLVMWATWATLAGLAGAGSLTAADYPSAAFSLVGAAACGTVVVTALRAGTWAPTVLDGVCLLLVIAGLSLWLTLDRPAIAVLTACLIDLIGVVPALPALWRRPDQQPTATFALIAAGGLCTAFAAWGTWTVTALAYPLYVTASTAAMAGLSLRSPRPRTDPPPGPDRIVPTIT